MKKYITPNTECLQACGAMLMYSPSDGNGSGIGGSNPTPGTGGSGPQNARVF